MRIGVNARVLLSNRMEGVARYIYEVTRRMAMDHPEDEIILFFDRRFDPAFIFGSNVKGVKIGLPARHPALFKLWFEVSIPRALKKHKIDVFFSGDAYLSLRSKVPAVMVSHDLAYIHYPEHIPHSQLKYYQKYFPRFHGRADHIIAVSQATKDDIIDQYGISTDKISIGYNSSPEGFSPVSLTVKKEMQRKYSGGNPYFVYLGSLHPRKNITNLINAYDRYRHKRGGHNHLVIIGRAAWKYDTIKSVYDQSPFRDDIHIYHNIGEEAKQILASAEALIYISLFEGFGIPILEAFSAEIPVITSNVSSMPEVAKDAAILVDPTDIDNISKAMIDIKNDHQKSELISKGKSRLQYFDWKNTADIVYQCIKQVYLHHKGI